MEPLAAAILSRDRLALARALTQVENETTTGQQILADLFPHTGQAHVVGVTGAPGTGKSLLVNGLAEVFRKPSRGKPRTVGVIAVDPSSPFSGGAVLGDRVRMHALSGDTGVFIRSMASRGALGGLARTTAALAQVLDAAGFEIIFIETVGAGQAEVDIARLAHTTLVVEAPGLGDDIQAFKAGILEIADILVLNKADLPGVEITERALRAMLELSRPQSIAFDEVEHHGLSGKDSLPSQERAELEKGWQVPLLRTVATGKAGLAELGAAIDEHAACQRRTGGWQERERERLQSDLDMHIQAALVSRWRQALPEERYERILNRVLSRRLSPEQAAQELLPPSRQAASTA